MHGEPDTTEGGRTDGVGAIRVAAVPSAHPYVQRLRGPGLRLLADPPVPGAGPGTWWPPQVLSGAWLRRHAAELDLVHVHFGTESLPEGRLAEALGTLRELRIPLVHTVHDLEHPHLVEQDRHARDLGLLVGAAAELLTLTDAAAEVVARRFGRRPTVVAHPQVAADGWFARADAERRGRGGPPVVGVHLRGLRANIRPAPWLRTLAEEVHRQGGVLRLLVNDEVRPGTPQDEVLRAFAALVGAGPVELRRRPRPDDDGLAAELAALDVSVLPYAHGTHSGWLELCWDLGTRVLSPAVGAIADQHAEPWAIRTFDPGRPAELPGALRRLLAAGPPPAAAVRLARRRRTELLGHATHLAAYRRALRPAGER